MDVRHRAPRCLITAALLFAVAPSASRPEVAGAERSGHAQSRAGPFLRHISVVWSAAAAEARIQAGGRDRHAWTQTGDRATGRTRPPRTSGSRDSRRSRADCGHRDGEPKNARDRFGPVVGADRGVSFGRQDREVGSGRLSPRGDHRRQAAADRAGRQDLVLAAAFVGSEDPGRSGVRCGQR